MRKTAVSVLMAIILCFCASGCSGNLLNGNSTSNVWSASDIDTKVRDVLTGTMEEDANGEDVWVARPLSLANIGYIDELMVKQDGVKLKKGLYRFTVNMSVDNNFTATESNHSENDLVMQLRVIDGDKNVAVESQEFYRRDFTKANEIIPVTMTFALSETTKVNLEAKYFSKATMKIKSYEVKGIDESQRITQDKEKYFFSADEDSIVLDKSKLYYFDLYSYMLPIRDSVFNYDLATMIAALQGLVNRTESLLFLRFNAPNEHMYDQDNFWLEYLQQSGKLLANKQIVEIKSPATLLRLFKDYYKGLSVWDEKVPATVNVACTASGVDDLLPLRYLTKEGSLYKIIKDNFDLQDKLNLVGKFKNNGSGKIADTQIATTKSAKNDAYLWAAEKYLATKKTHKTIMANHLDAYTWDKSGLTVSYYNIQQQLIANKDYYIANKAFFWDLSVWEDEAPNDDKAQIVGTDFATLDKLMRMQNAYADGDLTILGGFIPWWIKYTDKATMENKHQDVETEWRWASRLGHYYAVKDADAYGYTSMTNASVYSKSPMRQSYKQKAKVNEVSVVERAAQYIDSASGKVKARNYVFQYMGDYDAAAWMAMAYPHAFSDPNRGNMALGWPINSAPMGRFPVIYDYLYENATENDYFLGDHNGYGYIDLAQLTSIERDTSLKGNIDLYMGLAHDFWDKMDLSIMGLLACTTPGDYSESLKRYMSDLAYNGVVLNRQDEYMDVQLNKTTDGEDVPWTTEHDIGFKPPLDIAADFATLFSTPRNTPVFKVLRSICKTPTVISEIMRVVNKENPSYKITNVDPYVYMYLAEQYKIYGGISE